MSHRSRLGVVVTAATVLLFTSAAQAIVVDPYESSGANDSPPADDPGFENVGYTADQNGNPGVGSVVYLGNQWVITAAHVGVPYQVAFQGNDYVVDQSSPVQLQNSDGSNADLTIFRLDSAPSLPTLQIAPAQPVIREQVLMVGAGLSSQGNAYYHYDYTNQTYTQQSPPPVPGVGDVGGVAFGGNYNTVRWGQNVIDGIQTIATIGGTSQAFQTTFNQAIYTGIPSISDEAQLAVGDSGGGDFINGQLAGINDAISSPGGLVAPPPSNFAYYGMKSYMVQLAPYRQQIIAVTHTNLLGDTNGDGVVDQTDYNNVVNNMGKKYGTPIPGDLNGDGTVDFSDYQILQQHYGQSVAPFVGDINGDGKVNITDMYILYTNWGKQGTNIPGDLNGDGVVNFGDYQILMQNYGAVDPIGDINHDFTVNFADYQILMQHYGQSVQELLGDTNGDGVVDQLDLDNVLAGMGDLSPVPEPASIALFGISGVGLAAFARRRRS